MTMSILEKINFRQPKYMLPAILYLPLLGTSYFVFDLFRTGKAEVQDRAADHRVPEPGAAGGHHQGRGHRQQIREHDEIMGPDTGLHGRGQH